MATKKRPVKIAKKKASPRPKARRAAKRPTAPTIYEAPSAGPESKSRRGGWILLALLALSAALLWRRPQAPLPAPTAAEAPEARSVASAPAPELPALPKAEMEPHSTMPHRERAGASAQAAPQAPPARAEAEPKPSARPVAAHEDDSDSFDRSGGATLAVRCWALDGAPARLDVFGARNQRVRSLIGQADHGSELLRWDGKDDNGKAVPEGLYYLRPSLKGLQELRRVWVKG